MDTRAKIFDLIKAHAKNSDTAIANETQLIGNQSLLDSMKLVELCLELEDLASENGFHFDWTSEAAMSRSKGMFRTAGALADAFHEQMDSKK